MAKEYAVTVSEVREWADGIKSIFFSFNGERMPYKAGQYVLLKAIISGREVSRAYSLASVPNDENLEIIIRVVGEFTQYLNTLKVGDALKLIGPFGHFTLDLCKGKNVVFVATGTGISPLLGMARELHKSGGCKRFESITMVYGTRYKDMLVYREELEQHERECPNFRFVPVLSREENWAGRKGYVQGVVSEIAAPDTDYFICGLPAMTDEVEKILLERGIKRELIHLERY
ncbi:MAG: FAD-binding oxidoreductase [Candidatus Micrarchaeia archaeon]